MNILKGRKFGLGDEEANEAVELLGGTSLDALTVGQASDLIGALNGLADRDALVNALNQAALSVEAAEDIPFDDSDIPY